MNRVTENDGKNRDDKSRSACPYEAEEEAERHHDQGNFNERDQSILQTWWGTRAPTGTGKFLRTELARSSTMVACSSP
ncbi:hypothetical protein D3C74_310590 [compost metagenome]